MLNDLGHLPHLWELEFISSNAQRPSGIVCRHGINAHGNHFTVAVRKAIRECQPERGVHPHVVISDGLDYTLGLIEEPGKTCLRYNPCGSEEYIKY
jgi:hypothetical protein